MKNNIQRPVQLLVFLVGICGILGNIFSIEPLTSFIYTSVNIKFNTSLALEFCAVILFLLDINKLKWLTLALSILVMLMGITVIIQYKHAVSWNLDEIFVKDPYANGYAPGRMSPLMAYGFVISGIAFIGRTYQKRYLNEIPSIFLLIIFFLFLYNGLFDVIYLRKDYPGLRPSFNALIGMLLIQVSNILGQPDGFIAPFLSDTNSARLGFNRMAAVIFTAIGVVSITFFAGEAFHFSFSQSLILTAVLSLLVFGIILRKLTKIANEKEEALQLKSLQLRKLAEHLQNIREEERVEVSRIIHEELAQEMAAIKIKINLLGEDLAESGGNMRTFNELDRCFESTMQGLKRLNAQLRPQLLDDMGLIDAIEHHVSEFRKAYDIELITDIEMDFIVVEQHKALAVFRVLQECLLNLRLHSEAKHAIIHINQEENPWTLKVSITDDGKGFVLDDIRHRKSFGIVSMEERIISLGGKIQIITAPGEGTCILFEVPLESGLSDPGRTPKGRAERPGQNAQRAG